jgi:hypothetical protein
MTNIFGVALLAARAGFPQAADSLNLGDETARINSAEAQAAPAELRD